MRRRLLKNKEKSNKINENWLFMRMFLKTNESRSSENGFNQLLKARFLDLVLALIEYSKFLNSK